MRNSTNATDDFLNLYKELESCVNDRYGLTGRDRGVGWLLYNRRHELGRMADELEYCREVRNLLSHRPKVAGEYVVVPSQAMLETLRRIADHIVNPPLALSEGVPASKTFSCSMNDHVRPALYKMADCSYSHIPILEDSRVVGVFSENTLLSCLIDDEIVEISGDTTFAEVARHLPFEAHASETFRFVSRKATAAEVSRMFAEAVDHGERIGMVFVTENGKSTERLLGIVTAWDVAGCA